MALFAFGGAGAGSNLLKHTRIQTFDGVVALIYFPQQAVHSSLYWHLSLYFVRLFVWHMFVDISWKGMFLLVVDIFL